MDKNTTIGVIGAGTMGAGIAQVAATAGHKVVLYDTNSEALSVARNKLQKILARLVEKQKIDEYVSKEIIERIDFSEDFNKLSGCGLVVEAIIEDLKIKQQIFSKLETIVDNNAVLASNTSSLSIASIASACKKAERVIGLHFFNPAPLMPLVEVIPAVQSDLSILHKARELVNNWGKVTVVAKDTPGFIVNRVARPFYGEAIRIYEEGFGDMPTIDWAIKELGGFKMGPFELMDYIGNDVNYAVTETVFREFFYDSRYKPSFTQKRMVEANRLGRKSGIGYYDYRESAVNPGPVKDEMLGQDIVWRVLVMLINEAIDALYLNIASKEDLELAMTKGVNYPKGLLSWADEKGLNNVLDTLDRLYDEYHEERYRASPLLRKMVRNSEKFFN